jgi:hypothetical protein
MRTRDLVAVQTAMAVVQLRPCILCGNDADLVGAFVPHAAPTKAILYPICEPCLIFPDAQERIEAEIGKQPRLRVRGT